MAICPNSGPLQDIMLRNLSDLEFDLSRSLKVKCDSVIGLPIYAFLLMFNSNIWSNSAPLQDISSQNLSDLNLSRSLRSNLITAMDSPYVLSWPNSAPLRDTRLRNLSDFEFDLSRSLKVKCDGVIGLSIYGFLLIYIVTACLFSNRVAAIATQKRNVFSYLLSLGPYYEKSKVHRMTSKWPWMLQGQRYPTYVEPLPTSPNFTPFCSTIAPFPDKWGFLFLHRLQIMVKLTFSKKKKKLLKIGTQNLKNPKRSLVRTIGRDIQDKCENFWLQFVGAVGF